jgi:hypothetical protein
MSAISAELAAGIAEVLNPEGATGVDDTCTDEAAVAAVLLRYGCVGWTVGVAERDAAAWIERVKEGDAD